VPYTGTTGDAFDALLDNSLPITWMMVGGRSQRM
jgi:hypothetical protein